MTWVAPHDPHEEPYSEPDSEMPLDFPITLFGAGRVSREVERLADAILEARPGLLIVVGR
ncbi:MAG TPA: hypothetical protein VFZ00_19060 [Solirubrobacter sp.]|jgi:hypothetical protein|nr:hypothetical protein [Solirubrobacter sp.]